ncbi:MAG: hypothetical protein JSW00_12390 [Thermoplasmata archaeon]|nr:MAG: hypothetical protein JSW00_12390 [Thermoplasmata archaeon]
MVKFEGAGFLSLDKTEDQLVIATFVCVLLSLYFGLQPGLISAVLWAALGGGALLCIYFAFPNTWPYSFLLYACYGISAFGVILLFFWYDYLNVFGISLPILIGIFFIIAAFYMAFHIVQSVKKTRDTVAQKEEYLPLGFWSISVMFFMAFSVLSIISWSLWVDSGGGEIQFYMVLEPIIAFLLVYILWLPDRSLNWTVEDLPESPATKFIFDKSKVLKKKVAKVRNMCPECGTKLKVEKKSCPSCNNIQNFGWCVTSEAYVLPCTHCGSMALYGKEKCDACEKELTDGVECKSCGETFPLKEWAART